LGAKTSVLAKKKIEREPKTSVLAKKNEKQAIV
jgi:hypothetical protein